MIQVRHVQMKTDRAVPLIQLPHSAKRFYFFNSYLAIEYILGHLMIDADYINTTVTLKLNVVWVMTHRLYPFFSATYK